MVLHDVELLNLDTDKSVIRLFLYCTVDMSCHVLHGEGNSKMIQVGMRYNGYFSWWICRCRRSDNRKV